MRMIFSLIGLIIVLAIVGILTKKQLTSVTQLPNAVPNAAPSSTANAGNIADQSKQMQQQVKDQLNEATKAATEAREKALGSANNDKPVEKTGSAY